MSFEKNGQAHIDRLTKQRDKLQKKVNALKYRVHDCDCEYCDRQGEGEMTDDEAAEVAKMETKISDISDMIDKVKRHCELFGIKVEVPA
jgi:peptidoglycan hydrolase CwlO-like protein